MTLSCVDDSLTIQFVLPEMIAHAFLTLCFLLSGQWIAFLLNAPLVGYNVNKWVFESLSRGARQGSSSHRLHPTFFSRNRRILLRRPYFSYPRIFAATPTRLVRSAADEQNHVQESHVWRHRNLPYIIRTQEGIIHQTWFLPSFVLLLPLPVSPSSSCQKFLVPSFARPASSVCNNSGCSLYQWCDILHL